MIKGSGHKGMESKSRTPGMSTLSTVSNAKSLRGSTSQGFVSTKKSSEGAGFSASRKKGYVKGC